MMKIWALGMAIILTITLGIASLVLVTQNVRYGNPLDIELQRTHFYDIEAHTNSTRWHNLRTDSAWLSTRPSYTTAVNDILDMLNNAGHTNRLSQLFQAGGEEILTRNNSNTMMHSIRTNSNSHFLKLNFLTPIWSIGNVVDSEGRETGRLQFESAEVNPENQVHQVVIMLNDVVNGFQQHNWILSTGQEPTDRFMYRWVTWGNYYNLAQYVAELELVRTVDTDDTNKNNTGEEIQ